MDNDKLLQVKPARRKLDIDKIMKAAEELRRAEIKEKEWLKKHQQVQQSF